MQGPSGPGQLSNPRPLKRRRRVRGTQPTERKTKISSDGLTKTQRQQRTKLIKSLSATPIPTLYVQALATLLVADRAVFQENSVELAASHLRSIFERLDIFRFCLQKGIIQKLASWVKPLRGVRGLDVSWSLVGAKELAFLATKFIDFTCLSLDGCYNVSSGQLSNLAPSALPALQAFSARFTAINDEDVKAITERSPDLQRIELTNCLHVTDAGFQALAGNCPDLRDLTLRNTIVTDVGIRAVAASCQNLVFADLSGCKKLTDAGIVSLAAGCPNLRAIYVADCPNVTDQSVQELAQCCRQLQFASFANCSRVTDTGLNMLARGCSGLQKLDLDYTQAKDRGIEALAGHCSGLAFLSLVGCKSITDRGVVALARGCLKPYFLSLRDCLKVTVLGVKALSEYCPYLQHIDLTNCRSLGDEGVIALASCCSELRRVGLELTSVTDRGVIALAKGCPELETIKVPFTDVTDRGVIALAKHCPNLRVVELMELERVTISGIDALLRGCPDLALLYVGEGSLTERELAERRRTYPSCEIMSGINNENQGLPCECKRQKDPSILELMGFPA